MAKSKLESWDNPDSRRRIKHHQVRHLLPFDCENGDFQLMSASHSVNQSAAQIDLITTIISPRMYSLIFSLIDVIAKATPGTETIFYFMLLFSLLSLYASLN